MQELFREIEDLGNGAGMDGMAKRGGKGQGKGSGKDFGHSEHGDPLHWLHCFDYLRQVWFLNLLVIFCADNSSADMLCFVCQMMSDEGWAKRVLSFLR